MLQFLKESTFRANDVFFRAIGILGRHYISIAGLCFLLFIVSNFSTLLSIYFEEYADIVKVSMLLLFVVLYFSFQLVLFKRAVHLVKEEPPIGFWNYFPSISQFLSYILGLVVYSLIAGIIYLVMYVLCFPLLYLGIGIDTVRNEIHPLLTAVVMLMVVLRTVFYPFFIIEHNMSTWKAYKFSVAMTKGNVFSLLFIVLAVSLMHFMQIGSEYLGYLYVAKVFSVINSFVIVPLVSIVMSIAYIDMMKDYQGGDNPALMDNIL